MPPYFASQSAFGHGVIDVPFNLNPEWGVSSDHSNILAAVTATDDIGLPVVVEPSTQVLNITPQDNGVTVRINILWDVDITVRVALVIWP